ncbi:hypothetical protein CHS0354_034606 [Potamilus streckersoni]|uniref:Uncharacterized protein n=1 Tax=Potamilus streckersoni TaxID=2493646 RepID=A0AAE0W1V5_9BIVA|nr:hypothetical protein CHS0354_034606 [Potamilus streckersoni]
MTSIFRSSKSNKAEGVPVEKIKRLQKSLQHAETLASALKENSSALISQIHSQTLTVQKLHQDLNSQKAGLVVAELHTPLTGESLRGGPDVTRDRNECKISDRGRQAQKQQAVTPTSAKPWENEDLWTNVDAHHKGRQQDLREIADDLLTSLLHNNQTVLMNQAKAIQGTVEAQIHWLQSCQEDVGSLLSPNLESSSNEPDKKFLEKYRAIENEKITLTKNNEVLEAANKNLQRDFRELKKKYDGLDKENNLLKSKLARFNPPSWGKQAPPKIQVKSQIYCPRKTELTDSIITELTSMLKSKMDLYSLELNIINCESTTEIVRSLPVIVICLYASRLGTDVSNALQKVPVGPNVAVLVLHHKDIHALPAQTSDKILTGDEYRNIGAIIDMAFLSQKGVYTCNMNDRGLEDLTNFIKTHSNK